MRSIIGILLIALISANEAVITGSAKFDCRNKCVRDFVNHADDALFLFKCYQ